MSKIGYLIIIIIIGILIYSKFPRKVSKVIDQNIGNQKFSLEIADNLYLLEKGLSGRSQLCPNCGMLFIFNLETFQMFWMKDTLIPLDLLFINSQGIITDIFTANPEPGKNDLQLTLYKSSRPTRYVIELNAGTAEKLNIKAGDYLKLNI